MALIDGLIAYWTLNETSGNASDSSGHNYTLTNKGSVAYASGVIGNSAQFATDATHGNTNHVLYSANTGLYPTGDVSWSFWMYTLNASGDGNHGTPANWDMIACVLNADSGNETRIWAIMQNHDGPSQINLRLVNTSYVPTNRAFLWPHQDSTWYNVVITVASGTAKMYVNGAQMGSTATGLPTALNNSCTTKTRIGAMGGNSGGTDASDYPAFSGKIDEFGMWNRGLSAQEVASLYNSGTGLTYPFDSSVPDDVVNDSGLTFTHLADGSMKLEAFTGDTRYTIWSSV